MDQTPQYSCLVSQLKAVIVESGLASEQDQLNIQLILDCDRDIKLLELQAAYLLTTLNAISSENSGPVLPECYYETFLDEQITDFSDLPIECL